MIVHRILIDGLPFVQSYSNQPRVEFYKDPSKMLEKILALKSKHSDFNIDFEKIEIPDESSPSKQIIKNHELFHNPHSSWKKCDQSECRRLQIALQSKSPIKED